MTATTWAEVLDALEAHLGDLADVAAGPEASERFGDGGVPPLATPPGLGPIPAHLVDRAAALSVRMVELDTALRTSLADVRRELAASRRMVGPKGRTPGNARYLDTTA